MIVATLGLVLLQQTPPQSVDADTRAWWASTMVLSGDAMEGRDTGSPGFQRAADVVATRFAAAGLAVRRQRHLVPDRVDGRDARDWGFYRSGRSDASFPQ
ncbi:MAG: hypothetical protein U0163_07930 [Gemmatimonadaceae bacterium]